MDSVKGEISALDAQLGDVEKELEGLALQLPNLPADAVPRCEECGAILVR